MIVFNQIIKSWSISRLIFFAPPDIIRDNIRDNIKENRTQEEFIVKNKEGGICHTD